MYTMHYEITLPTDYDMGIIRARVATRGGATDDFPGLRFKAYLLREAGVDGSPVNQYAPFYLWDDTDAMGAFLWGGKGFGGIVTDFGRPVVQTWAGVDVRRGRASSAAFATKETYPIPDGADPATIVPVLQDTLEARSQAPGVHTAVLAVDPRTWQAVLFTLWESRPSESLAGVRYAVLHLSEPDRS
ncbi:MAG TPA: DUF4865 family protein [Lacisediminihabitans sp.]|uniref:DUF4865 family protein n=1 Tax=Lacisediminihabitans sp. TaxID=2787631 RepID=UPI002EDA00AC